MARNKQVDGQLSLTDIMSTIYTNGPDSADSDDDSIFEKEYERLMGLFDKVRTADFDPMKYIMAVVNGVKTSRDEKIDFKEALSGYVSDSAADMITKAFSGDYEKELFDIVSSLHDEI